MVVVLCTRGTWVGMVVPNSLEARQGVSKYAYPVVGRECGEGRVDGYQLRSHNCAGLFRPGRINVNSSAGGEVYHRSP